MHMYRERLAEFCDVGPSMAEVHASCPPASWEGVLPGIVSKRMLVLSGSRKGMCIDVCVYRDIVAIYFRLPLDFSMHLGTWRAAASSLKRRPHPSHCHSARDERGQLTVT